MNTILTALRLFVVLSVLTGIVYPVAMTAFSETVFTKQATGSLIERDGKIVGSSLLAQKTEDPKYFWPRPSAANYGTIPSGASNQGILSKTLAAAVATRKAALSSTGSGEIPADLFYASGSGLDPHISPAAASFQIDRVASARGFDVGKKNALTELVGKFVEGPQFGVLGDARVNVLHLNLALDRL